MNIIKKNEITREKKKYKKNSIYIFCLGVKKKNKKFFLPFLY